jgi:hypothetical protein
MGAVAGIGGLVVLMVLVGGYQSWLRKGIQSRQFVTSLPADEVRRLFAAKVGGFGWHVVDDDNPIVAQSPLLGGRRQQISLQIVPMGAQTQLKIWVSRMWTKGLFNKVPYKAHTLRLRMNAFERATASGVR